MVEKICKPVLQKEIYTCISLKDGNKYRFDDIYLHGDDTIEDVLNKISIYCFDKRKDVKKRDYRYIFAYYLDKDDNKCPLGFNYANIIFNNLIENDSVDELFVDGEGNKRYIPLEKNYSTIIEKYSIKNNEIYFLSLDEYLDHKELKDKLIKNKLEISDELLKSEKSVSLFNNGVIKKYWPLINNFTEIYNPELLKTEKDEYKRLKSNYTILSERIDKIEKYYDKNNETFTDCNFTITIMKLMKKNLVENQMKLIDLFSDFTLSEDLPFIKIMFDSYEDNMYKIHKKSLSVNGGFITKDMCKAWTDDYKIQEYYGFNYIYSGNLIEMKLRFNDMYISLIIKKDGNVECLIDNNDNLMNEKDIIELVEHCNNFIEEKINSQKIYSYTRENLQLFDLDFLSNRFSETKLDFMNCGMYFPMEKKSLQGWGKHFDLFFQNYLSFFRPREHSEYEDDPKFKRIKSVFRSIKYTRVNNYKNMNAIQSMISLLSNPDNKLYKEDILTRIIDAFNLSDEQARYEYELFLEQSQQILDKRRNVYIKVPNEEGITINIYEPTSKDDLKLERVGFDGLLFDIKNVKTFTDFKRLSQMVSSMIDIFLKKKELFNLFSKQLKREISFKTTEEESSEKIDEPTQNDELNEEIKKSSESDSFDSDSFGEFDSESSEGLDGGGKGKNELKIKSYYNDRLKKYDKDLFVFDSLLKQPNGVSKGYTKYCTMSPARGHRQPIAVTTKELQKIKENDKKNGKSIANSLSVEGRSDDIHYICPKYWDTKTNLSLNPELIHEFKDRIIPEDVKKIDADSDQSIIERRYGIWENDDNIDNYRIGISSKSLGYHPDGYGLPCCFNPAKDKPKKGEEIIDGNYDDEREEDEREEDEKQEEKKDEKKEEKQKEKKKKSPRTPKHDLNEFKIGIRVSWNAKGKDNFGIVYDTPTDNRISIKDENGKKKKIPYTRLTIVKQEKKTNRSQQSESVVNYISKEEPILVPGRYAHINESIQSFLGDDPKEIGKQQLNKRGTRGFLKRGVKQNDGSLNFTESPFLNSYIECAKQIIHLDNINDLLGVIKETLENNIVIYQKCPEIVNDFMQPINNSLLTEDIEYFKKIFDYEKENIVDDLLKKEIYYKFNLSRSLKNYLEFLNNTEEERNDKYILPILTKIFKKINIIIFENIDGEIRIKYSDKLYKGDSKQYVLIYKGEKNKQVYYEPIIYRSDKVEYEYLEEFIDEKIDNIITQIENSLIYEQDIFQRKFLNNRDKNILFFVIDNLSYVSHIGLKGGAIIPIVPEKIPNFYNDKSSIKLIYDIKLSKYENIINEEYLEKYDLKIQGIVVDKKDQLCNIIFDDNLYLPVKPVKYQRSKMNYPIIERNDLYKIEKQLFSINEDDSRKKFYDYIRYEKYITNLVFQHIVQEIYNNRIIIQENYIDDPEQYTEGEIVYLTYSKRIIDGEEKEYLKKLTISEHKYYNFSIQAKINEINRSSKKIKYETTYTELIRSIINDEILVKYSKKQSLKNIIDDLTKDLFILLEDSEYEKYKENEKKILCNTLNTDICEYPCKVSEDSCKLFIKEKDLNGNNLKDKIINLFIEKLLIYKLENLDKITREEISIKDLKKSVNKGEIFYTFHEYDERMESSKESLFIYNLFLKQSNYYKDRKNIVEKDKNLVQKMQNIPNFIFKLFGDSTKILMQFKEDDSDFLTLQRSLNSVFQIFNKTDIVKLKTILTELNPDIDYTPVDYRVNAFDLSLLIEKYELLSEDIAFYIVINDNNKFNSVLSYSKDKLNDLTNIIPLYINEDKGLCNIVIEGEYYFTLNQLSGNSKLMKSIENLLEK